MVREIEIGSAVWVVEENGDRYEAVVTKLTDDDRVVVQSEMTGKVYMILKHQVCDREEES